MRVHRKIELTEADRVNLALREGAEMKCKSFDVFKSAEEDFESFAKLDVENDPIGALEEVLREGVYDEDVMLAFAREAVARQLDIMRQRCIERARGCGFEWVEPEVEIAGSRYADEAAGEGEEGEEEEEADAADPGTHLDQHASATAL